MLARVNERIRSSLTGASSLVCLVVAQRIATGQARTFPKGVTEKDERGLRMEIVG